MYNQTKRMMAIGGFCLISSIALSAQISLKLHNKKTSDVITEIEQVSDYRFFYNNGLSGLSKVISAYRLIMQTFVLCWSKSSSRQAFLI